MMHDRLARHAARRAILTLVTATGMTQVVAGEPVTHHFRGTVDYVTNGTEEGSIDLTGLFSIGQTLQLSMTVERSTPPFDQQAVGALYRNAVTQFGFTLGTYTCTGAGFDLSAVTNLPVGDEYAIHLGNLTAPSIGNAVLHGVSLDLIDSDSTAFASTALPR